MSQENVEIVRQSLDAYSRRDIDALRTLNDAEFELDWSASHSWLAGIYRGFEDALRFYEGYFDVFERIVFEPEDFIEAEDLVVVPNAARQWGRDGIEVVTRSALVFTVHDHKITRACLYQDLDQALKAVGLKE